MRQITIVGGGQAGLPLAIGLLKAGYRVRLVQNRTAADLAHGKVMSSQCVFGTARDEERKLGLDLWDKEAPAVTGMRIAVAAPDGSGNKAFGFVGNLAEKAQSVDQRVKFPRFLELFEQLGGTSTSPTPAFRNSSDTRKTATSSSSPRARARCRNCSRATPRARLTTNRCAPCPSSIRKAQSLTTRPA